MPACMYVAYFSTFYNLLTNVVSIHQLIERMVEIYTQLYIHLCMHKIPHSFDHCDCIAFRLYANLLSTRWPNAYCAIFLNKLVNLYNRTAYWKYIECDSRKSYSLISMPRRQKPPQFLL